MVVALRFLDIIEDVQVLLSEFPKSGALWDFVGRGIRRWDTTGFPYGVFYRDEGVGFLYCASCTARGISLPRCGTGESKRPPRGGLLYLHSAGTFAASSERGCARWGSISFGQTCRKLRFSTSQFARMRSAMREPVSA